MRIQTVININWKSWYCFKNNVNKYLAAADAEKGCVSKNICIFMIKSIDRGFFVAVVVEFNDFAVLIYRADTYQSAFLLFVDSVSSPFTLNGNCSRSFGSISFEAITFGWFGLLKCESGARWTFRMWFIEKLVNWNRKWHFANIDFEYLYKGDYDYGAACVEAMSHRHFQDKQPTDQITIRKRQYIKHLFIDSAWIWRTMILSADFFLSSFLTFGFWWGVLFPKPMKICAQPTHLFLNPNYNNNDDDFHSILDVPCHTHTNTRTPEYRASISLCILSNDKQLMIFLILLFLI